MRTRIEQAINNVKYRLKTAKPEDWQELQDILDNLLTARATMEKIDKFLILLGE